MINVEQNDSDRIVLAKDIDDCSKCPLYKHDCNGGWHSSGNGTPIEPPCCSWNENEEIYEGMYECNTYEPSEQVMKWEAERAEQIAIEQRKQKELEYKEEITKCINRISKYGNAKVKYTGSICYSWFCPNCNRWVQAWHESCHNGIIETTCPRCGEKLASKGVESHD